MGLSVRPGAVRRTCSVGPTCQTEPWSGETGLLGSLLGPLLLGRSALLLLVVTLRDLAWHIVLPDLESYAAVVGAAASSTLTPNLTVRARPIRSAVRSDGVAPDDTPCGPV
jgi:hypothetical protein